MNNILELIQLNGEYIDYSEYKTSFKCCYKLKIDDNLVIELRFFKEHDDFSLSIEQFRHSICLDKNLKPKEYVHNLSGFSNYYENELIKLKEFFNKLDLKTNLENKLILKGNKEKIKKI